ncbi:MAG: Gfo/Idh/MocA family oxidoreductase [Phycisphaerae bacterium]|nr:Gfo/Idh/MocA family oxidoreductase [Phycisphaerae bacterium]
MEKLGVGIIGCGWVAEEHIKAYQNDGRSEVRALVSRNRANAERYKDRYDLKCTIQTDYEKMLTQDNVDIVVVCTPNDSHAEFVIAAAQAKKHIAIEKPVALKPKDVRKELEAVRKSKVKTIVSFVLHWNPLLMTIDSLIDRSDEVFGDIFMVQVDYLNRTWLTPEEKWYASKEKAGTALLLSGCHAVDALRWFARSEAEEVFAYQTKTDNPIEFPGTISVNVKFENGRLGRTATVLDAQMPYQFNISIFGTDATLRNDKLYAPKLFPGQDDFLKIPCILPDSKDVTHHPFQGEASHFLDCILKDKQPFPDLEDAAKTHFLCFAADLSAQQGRPVKIKELQGDL